MAGPRMRFESPAWLALLLAAMVASSGGTSRSAHAQTVTWLGAGTTAAWTDAGNWSAAPPSTGGTLVFSGTSRLSNTNGGAVTSAAGLIFSNNGSQGFTGAFSVAGNAIGLTGTDSLATARVFTSSTITDTIAAAISLDGVGSLNRVTVGSLHDLTLSGNLSGAGQLVKLGDGTLTLAGQNSNTGATAVRAGALTLDYSTSNTSKLADTAALTLGSGAVNFVGGTHVEAVQSTSLVGAMTINRVSGSAVLQLGAISREAGGVLITSTTAGVTATVSNTNGIIGGWAVVGTTFGVADWAVAGTSGTLTRLTSYTGLPTSGFSGTVNYNTTGNVTLSAGNGSVNSLKLAANNGTLTLSGNAMTVESGGIMGLQTTSVGGTGSFTAGAGSNYELFLQKTDGSQNFTFGPGVAIVDNGANAVSVTKAGSGPVLLNGTASTYTGTTRIMQGTLQAAILANGGVASSIGQSSAAAANLVLDGGSLQVGSNNQSTDRLFTVGVGGGTLRINGSGLNFTNSGAIAFSGSGARTFSLTTGNNSAHTGTFSPVLGDGLGGPTTVTRSAAGTWTLTAANTYTGPTLITGTATLAVTSLANGGVASGIGQSSSAAGNLFLDSGVLSIASAVATVQSTDRLFTVGSGGATLSSSGAAGSGMVFTNTGAIAFAGDGARTVTLRGSRTGTFAPQIGDGPGGATSLAKLDAGNWTLTGSNTFTGTTTISSGTLTLGNVDALRGSTLSGSVAFAAGANAFNLGGLAGSSNQALGSNSFVVGWNGSSTSYSGKLSGVGGLAKAGGGTLTLVGANTYAGTTSVNAGTLQLGDGGATGSLNTASVITGSAGATLAFNRNDAISQGSQFANGIGGGVGVTQMGSGTVTLTAGNFYTGQTTVLNGALALGATDAVSNQSGVVVAGGAFNLATFSDTVASVAITSGSIIGSGTLTAATYGLGGGIVNANLGGGTLNVTANSALNGTSGATAVNLDAGVLTLGSGGRFTSAAVAVGGSAGASLVLGGNESFGSLAGAASVALGSGTLSVGGANTSTTYAGSLSGAGSFAKVGSGMLTLTGSHSHAGGTTVSRGTLSVNGYLGGSSALVVEAGATVGGSGVIAGGITGDGLIGPGQSPGILSTSSIIPTSTTSFAFEFTQLGAPTWNTGTASGNDVLRLTDPTTPFAGSLVSSNVVNIYFNVGSLSLDDTFLGGFFTDKSGDFLSFVQNATFDFYVLGDGFGTATSYNGVGYYDLNSWAATNVPGFTNVGISTVPAGTTDFASGTITTGRVTQFAIIPEPDTIIGAGIGIALAGRSLWRRRRVGQMARP